MRRGREKQHPNKLVGIFLESFSDASHLFFAKHIIPQLGQIDFEIDHKITSLASKLNEDDEEVQHEDF
jgi:hypothetical protein